MVASASASVDERTLETIRRRVAAGQPTVLLGCGRRRRLGGELPGYWVIRVECDVPDATLGVLLRARRQILTLLDRDAPLLSQVDQARERVFSGIRRRLLGDAPDARADASFLAACSRLLERTGGKCVLLFDDVEAADRGSLVGLRALLSTSKDSGTSLPLVLCFRTTSPVGEAAELVNAARAAGGDEAIVELAEEPPLPTSAGVAADTGERGAREILSQLPGEVVWTLRCMAVVGPAAEVEFIARLLDSDVLEVLRTLQRGVELGCVLDDDGDGGVMLLDAQLTEMLRRTTLPSLRAAWHRRAARLLGALRHEWVDAPGPQPEASVAVRGDEEGDDHRTDATRQSVGRTEARARLQEDASTSIAAAAPAASETAAEGRADAAASTAADVGVSAGASAAGGASDAARDEDGEEPIRFADMFVPPTTPWSAEAAEPTFGAPPRPQRRSRESPPAPDPDLYDTSIGAAEPTFGLAVRRRPLQPGTRRHRRPQRTAGEGARLSGTARAARHLAEAGELLSSAERYLEAAREAAAHGDYSRAAEHAQVALEVARAVPDARARRRLEIHVNVEFARLQWHASGPDPAFTLAGALEAVDHARAQLGDDDPVELHVAVASLAAGVCYDLGDLHSLERALAELSGASRLLMAAGDPRRAASLLNDQAAVYVRLGDPVRAIHLLNSSREVFERAERGDPSDVLTRVELAETYHLLARLPLHARLKPGREAAAVEVGLRHAETAARYYEALQRRRELARVWETMGRLEMNLGRLERAAPRLQAALTQQREIGDATGLARSAAAVSEYLLRQGQGREALEALADSIAFNVSKGSPIGLAFNRRALATITDEVLTGRQPPALHEELLQLRDVVRARLEAGERAFGRVHLAGEGDEG